MLEYLSLVKNLEPAEQPMSLHIEWSAHAMVGIFLQSYVKLTPVTRIKISSDIPVSQEWFVAKGKQQVCKQ